MNNSVVIRFGRGFDDRGRDGSVDLSQRGCIKYGMLASISRYAIRAYYEL